jgi:hypothetical protein
MQKVAAQRLPKTYSDNESADRDQRDNDDIEMSEVDIPNAFDAPQPDFDPPRQSPPPPLNIDQSDRPDRRARVEEVEDEEAGGLRRWVEDYPQPAGTAGPVASSYFEQVRAEQVRRGQDPWAPFEDQDEWELAEWLMMNVGQNATDKYLKLPIVSGLDRKNNCKAPSKKELRHANEQNHHLGTSALSTNGLTASHMERNGNVSVLK